jgi:hypothetical protein
MTRFFNISLEQQDEKDTESYIGRHAKARVSESKLLDKIECDDDPQTLVQEFMEKGGEIVSVDGKTIYLETASGNFSLPRFCVKIKKPVQD